MRMKWLGGGALAAGLLVFLGVAAGPKSTPPAFAQSCESDEAHCVIITALADGDEEFSFNDGDIQLGAGESEAINVDLDGSLTVTQDETDGWVVQGIDCNDDEFAEVDLDAASVSFDFSDFDDEDAPLTIECVFGIVEEAAAGTADDDADAADDDADAADDDADAADDEADADTADDESESADTSDEADNEGDDANEANVADDDDTTPTSTTTTTTSGASAQTTATPSETPMIILGNTGNPTGNPSSAQTTTAPQTSQQAPARSISPPSTGSGGLK